VETVTSGRARLAGFLPNQWGLVVSAAPKKSASDVRVDFLRQKTLEHFCLRFRARLPSIQEQEQLKRPARREKSRK